MKRLKIAPLILCGVVIGLFCVLQALTDHYEGFQFFQRLELITYDWRVRKATEFNPPVVANLGFVYIGNESIAVFNHGLLGTNFQFGLYWPRHVYGRVVRELKAQGAKAIGLDVLFSEHRLDHPSIDTAAGRIESDKFFQQQLREAGNVVLGASADTVPHPMFRSAAWAMGDISNERDSDGVLRRVRAFHDYRIWNSNIQQQAALNNWDLAKAVVQTNRILIPAPNGKEVVLAITEDGLFDPGDLTGGRAVRGFVRLQKAFEEARVWHLGIVLAARELNLDLTKARVELENRRVVLPGPEGMERIVPIDRRGQVLIDWSMRLKDTRLTSEAFEELVAHDVLRAHGTNVANRFSDRLVIVGSTATGNELSDRGATPLEKDTFLTSQHWNVANSMITGRFIRPTSSVGEFALIAVLGLAAAGLNWRLRAILASSLVTLVGLYYVVVAAAVFVLYRQWLPLFMPLSSLAGTHFALTTYQAFFEQKERRRVKNLFAKIVSPNVVNELLRAKKLSLVGARRRVTVFFADVRGFTELTDISHAKAEEYVREHGLSSAAAETYFDAQSQEVLHTVNLYLGLIADTIKQHEGTLDKYIGDCVMAFWGAPTPNDKHALACVRAAVDTQRAIHSLNQDRAAENKRREEANVRRVAEGQPLLPMQNLLSVGTGINTGVVTVGLMGSDAHIVNYTVFGREVNLAARLEGHSGRGRIFIGEATHTELLRDDPSLASSCVELPPATFKGFRTAVNLFEVPWKPAAISTAEAAAQSAGVAGRE